MVRGTAAADPKMKTLSAIEAELAMNVRLWGHTISRSTSQIAVSPGIVQVFWVPATRTLEDAIGPDKDRFSNRTMCTWLPSFEQHAMKKYDLGGLLRPAFEVSLKDSGGAKRLDPSSATDANPLCLFTIKRIELKPFQLFKARAYGNRRGKIGKAC